MFSCSSTSSSTLWLPARPYRMFLCQLYCVHKHMVHTVISIVSSRVYVVCVQFGTMKVYAPFRIVPHVFLFHLFLLLSCFHLLSSLTPSSPSFPSSPFPSSLHYSYLHLNNTTKTSRTLAGLLHTSFCSQHRQVAWFSISGLPTLSLSMTQAGIPTR